MADQSAPQGFDVFISYRSTATVQARAVKAALQGLAGNGPDHAPFRVFLDQSSLKPGDLSNEIRTALDRSHALVVLLARDTHESKWVNDEIAHWLANGGSPDRLFLVRLDDIDLTWDDTNGGFLHPDALPQALRRVFPREQKWIDLSTAHRKVERIALAPVFAAIRGVSPESLMLEESARQRRRQRTITGVAVTMAVLLVIAVAAGIWSIVNMNAAQAAAVQARAEADAAQTVLIGENSPAKAAAFVLRAAQEADSPSLRAAMLYAAANSRHLMHTIDTDGLSVAGGSLTPTALTVWGEGEHAEVRMYDVQTGLLLASGTVEGAITGAHAFDDLLVVACVEGRVELIRRDDDTLTATPLDTTPAGAGDTDCAIEPLTGGAAVRLGPPGGEVQTFFVAGDGSSTRLATTAAFEAQVTETADTVLVQIPGEAIRVWEPASNAWHTVPGTAGMTVVDHDSTGALLLKSRDDASPSWAFSGPQQGYYAVTPISVSELTYGLAAITDDNGNFTGDVVAIDAAGRVTASGRSGSVTVGNPVGYSGWRQYLPSVVRMSPTTYLAVFGQSAMLVQIDTSGGADPSWNTTSEGWATLSIPATLGTAPYQGSDPILSSCMSNYGQAILPANASSQYLLVSRNGYRTLSLNDWDAASFTRGCSLVETTPALAWRSVDPSGDAVALPTNSATQTIVNGPYAVLLDGASPIEIHTSSPLATPWQWIREQNSTVVTGEGGNTTTLMNGRIVFVEDGRPVASVAVSTPVLSVQSPDGRQVAMVTHDPDTDADTVSIVTRDGITELIGCAGVTSLGFAPRSGFDTDAKIAATAIPVGTSALGEAVDCTTGEPWESVDPALIDRYVIDEADAQILYRAANGDPTRVAWADGRMQLTVFALDALKLPTAGDEAGRDGQTGSAGSGERPVAWTDDGSRIAIGLGGRGIAVAEHSSDGWSPATLIYPQVRRDPMFTFIGPDGLLLAMDAEGAFEVIDSASGRMLVSDTESVSTAVTSLTSTYYDGLAVVTVRIADTDTGFITDDASLTIPLSRDRLRDQLCFIHRLSVCEP
ncbi:MAG: toll/interleukin-1 receptor domain-containing protein [Microbacterium sp.]